MTEYGNRRFGRASRRVNMKVWRAWRASIHWRSSRQNEKKCDLLLHENGNEIGRCSTLNTPNTFGSHRIPRRQDSVRCQGGGKNNLFVPKCPGDVPKCLGTKTIVVPIFREKYHFSAPECPCPSSTSVPPSPPLSSFHSQPSIQTCVTMILYDIQSFRLSIMKSGFFTNWAHSCRSKNVDVYTCKLPGIQSILQQDQPYRPRSIV